MNFYGSSLLKQLSGVVLITFTLLFTFLSVTAQKQNHTNVAKNQNIKNTAVNFANRAVEYEREGKYDMAVANYKHALSLNPKDAAIYNNLGTVYAKQKKLNEALKTFQQAITLNPNLALAHYNLGVVYDYLGRPEEALASARRALKIDPKNVKPLQLNCELSLIQGMVKDSAGCYKTLQKLKSLDGKSLTYYGIALIRTKKFKRAIPILEKAVQLSPNRISAHNFLGVALYKKKRYKEAVKAFKRGLQINPDNGEIRHNLAVAQLFNGNKGAALVHYSVLKGSNPALAQRLYKVIYGDKVVFVEAH